MLFPKFSLRLILAGVTALCCFFPVVSFAVRGHAWAIAISVVAGSVLIMTLLYGVMFCFAWLLTLVSQCGRWLVGGAPVGTQSPFASDRLPPVLVTPPPDPED